MSTLLSSISEFFAALFGRAARPYPGITATRGLDAPVNDAAAYGVGIEEARPPSGQLYWKVQRVHHLTADENNFRQHIFVDMQDEAGNRLQGGAVRVSWPGGNQIVTLDKPPGEPAGNFPMWKYQVCEVTAIGMPGETLVSDKVTGLHTSHKDEGPGNRLFHHSFALVFQRTLAGAAAPARESVISGRVSNGAGRTLLLLQEGASVAQTVVAADESYSLTALAAGTYQVAVQGADVRSDPVTVDGRGAATVNLTLPAAPKEESMVSGRVLRGAGKTIELYASGALVHWTLVAADERYQFTGLPAGLYRVGIAGKDVVSEDFHLDGVSARQQDLEIPESAGPASKPLTRYVLFAPLNTVQGQIDWLLAAPYLQAFGLTAGANLDHAKLAAQVTMIGGGPDAPGAAVEQALAAAGCRVERIAGDANGVAAELAQRIEAGQP